MPRTAFAGTGFYVPDRVVKNDELTQYMDTSDEWIIERTGIQERRWVTDGMTSAEMACRASKMAISAAGIEPGEIDAIVLGTLWASDVLGQRFASVPGVLWLTTITLLLAQIPLVRKRYQGSRQNRQETERPTRLRHRACT